MDKPIKTFTTTPDTGVYGARIYVREDYLTPEMDEILDRLSIWGGHDKTHEDFSGKTWFGWEFRDRFADARKSLLHLDFIEIPIKEAFSHPHQH
jgi:hypothetical protein